jgi:hypothetical protein
MNDSNLIKVNCDTECLDVTNCQKPDTNLSRPLQKVRIGRKIWDGDGVAVNYPKLDHT